MCNSLSRADLKLCGRGGLILEEVANGWRTSEVDAYLRDLEPSKRAALEALRSLILEEVPEAVETMRYRMPTYEHEGKAFCAFASQNDYMSLYVMNTRVVGKGTESPEHRKELHKIQ